jgi:amidase
MSDDFAHLDATAQAELVSSGEASPTELVDAAIARVEALNPELNAVIHDLSEEGRQAAAGELPDGPFKGVPFLFKDIGAALAGQPFHLGSRVLKEVDFRIPVDTYLGQRFRDAGFVTIGKTNVPELGILPTTEPVAYGPSKNPWDTSRSTGGSSGGSAAAVASGMVAVAHANDGGGSIRIPAAANGLVGLKPTRQRTSEGPMVGDNLSGLTAELVVSKSVRDAASILEVVHGAAPGDPYVAPAPTRPYTDELEADPKGLRIGLMTQQPVQAGVVDPAVVDAARRTGELLESLGHSVEEIEPSAFGHFDGAFDTFMVRWMAGQAALATQVSALAGRELGADDFEPVTWALIEGGRAKTAGEYLLAVGHHQVISRQVAAWYEAGNDLLLTPTLGELPPPLGTFDAEPGGDPIEPMRRASLTGGFCGPFNITGQPAISLPLEQSDEGLPIGVQLAAAFGREDTLIAVAAQLERARPWAERRPPVFATAAA